ncbi:ATP-dependent nuclease [Variovorax ginsengisoli]|uniref:ATP-dependent endonuclease of OLD family n=1 Tax=Variovorax ginsengisoli TaxID=363844 RepID=A0ABT9S1U2_9BURK|nr:ATP-binding protein [Variovorax ginsengisoli]MDP9898315.1 putative ATP-dependent endonuclease of OLD family [Variovorax ginsengisoli]
MPKITEVSPSGRYNGRYQKKEEKEMRLSQVVVNNFCSCQSVDVPLAAFNPIVGYNNSGKSNILRAISWLLKKSALPAHRFFDTARPVTVEGVIENVNLALLPQNQRQAVTPFVNGGALRVRRRQDSPTTTAAQIKLDVFNSATGAWVDNPAGLDTALAVLFPEPLHIEAMEDAGEDVGKFGAKNTIGLLLKHVLAKINAQNAAAIAAMRAALTQVSGHLNGATRMAELGAFEVDATDAITSFFPGLSLHLNFETPAIDDLFKSSTVTLSDAQGLPRPFTSFGHGAQRSAHMALIKLLADLTVAGAGNAVGTTVLLIDEPELYLHPQAVELLRESLVQLSKQNFQIIFSTHSPLLIGRAHALNTLMIYKSAANSTVARNKLQAAAVALQTLGHHAEALFSLQHASHFLFSESILLVEGKTEQMLLPLLYQTVRGHTYAHNKGCIVPGSSSSALLPMKQILAAVGFAPKILADLDFAFKIAPREGLVNSAAQEFLDCKAWFAANATAHGFCLDASGLPARKDQQGNQAVITPAEAFEKMAAAMQAQVAQIGAALLGQDIWVWPGGAIEAHLGIGKTDTDRVSFLNTATQSGNLNHATTPLDLSAVLHWMG